MVPWRLEWVWSFSPGRTASTMSWRPLKALVGRPSWFGTLPPRWARSMLSCCLAASRMATTCALERSLDFLPSCARSASLLKPVGRSSGICNGFQVLTEAHLLPGALQKNKGLTFLCQMTELEVVSDRSALTAGVEVGRRLRVPINHFEGNYTASASTLRSLEAEGRVVLRYVGNPNGSVHDIAAVCNEATQRRRADAPPRTGYQRAPRVIRRAGAARCLAGDSGLELGGGPHAGRPRKTVTNLRPGALRARSSCRLLYGGAAPARVLYSFSA